MRLPKSKIFWIITIFLFSVSLRLWNINQMGRTWDEMAQLVKGYQFIELTKKGDFLNKTWYLNPDHPPLKDYTYGLTGYLDIESYNKNGPIYRYDLTYSRLLSVLYSSITIAVVVALGWEFISPFVGIAGGIILAMLPFFLGLSQLVTIETPLILFFTSAIYAFLKFLKSFSLKTAILTGLFMGFALGTKFTNILLFILIILIYFLWYFMVGKKKKKKLFEKKLIIIFSVAFAVFFAIWPMPWFHLNEVFNFNYQMRFANAQYSIPEVFFGKLRLVPVFYYVTYLFITTPLLILIFFFIGLKSISKKKTFILIVLVLWFCFPFVQSFYNFRQHGLRYIIEIYAPLSLIAAIGLESVIKHFTKKFQNQLLLLIPIIMYLFIILIRITPYYLDYFNMLTGGTYLVNKYNIFQQGWWGQGIREAILYLTDHSEPKATVGLAVIPLEVVPPTTNLKTEKYKKNKQYNFVIVSHYNIIREGFDDSEIKKNYKAIYFVKADGAVLVTVYKHK